MKRITHILKDAFCIIGSVLIIGTTLFAATSAAAQDDIYEIEQTIDQPFNELYINQGWDVRLIQAPAGSPTTMVISTRCAEFFEEGAEPNIATIGQLTKRRRWLEIEKNQSMPKNTVVEIHTAEPIKRIHLYRNARLKIMEYDFDSVDLSIDVDSGAVLTVDTMSNHHTSMITVQNATLDLRHAKLKGLSIYSHGTSTINKGKLLAQKQYIYLSDNSVCNVTESDTAHALYVKHRRWLNTPVNLMTLNLTGGLDMGFPIANTDGAQYGSPYNTNFDLGAFLQFTTGTMTISGRWGWNIGLRCAYHMVQLDNVVQASGTDRLVLDSSNGATPPRQNLLYTTLGLPVSITYTLPMAYRPWFRGFHASLTPMVNFKQTLSSQSLGTDNRRKTTENKHLDLYNRFNLRAAIGVDMGAFGLKTVEFFVDMLPSYKATADAPQVRMMGLVYHF